jgi:hypothetical protein
MPVLSQQFSWGTEEGHKIRQLGSQPRFESGTSCSPDRTVTAVPKLLGVKVSSTTLSRFGSVRDFSYVQPPSKDPDRTARSAIKWR